MTTLLQTAAPHLAADPPYPGEPQGGNRPRKYRPDIEGLRAVAVLLVVLYHAKLLAISGGYVGVDVFFVISGFLIIRQLVGGIGARGIGELPAFYARRMRRLLPASTVVVVSTVIAAWFWAPATQARATFTDAIYTTFYGLNYHLAYNGTQYLHQGDAVSPLQHFWSLGVEEQFYVVTPILVVLAMLLPISARYPALLILLGAIFAGSLYLSITTSQGSTWAYFGLHTRAWEMAAGGLIALSAQQWSRLPRLVTNTGAWAGLGVIVASAWLLNDDTIYPGYAALMPVLATALVIGCGCASRYHSIERLFAEPALQGIGKVSYSWYLWHWPMLVLLPLAAGESLNWARRAEIVLLSLLFAIVSYHVVENPVRKLKRLNFEWMRTGLALAAIVIGAAVVAGNILPSSANTGVKVAAVTITTSSKADSQMTAALTKALNQKLVPSNLEPATDKANDDYTIGCISNLDQVNEYHGPCERGDPKGTVTIGLLGDSHALHWSDGLNTAARSMHERLVMRTKAGCPFATGISVEVFPSMRPYTECDQWRPQAIKEMVAIHPAFIILSQADAVGSGIPPAAWAAGTAKTIKTFTDAGIKVIYIRDIPHALNQDSPDCIAKHLKAINTCAIDRAAAYQFPKIHQASYDGAVKAGATILNPEKWFCVRTRCPATVANVLIYRDNTGHMSASMSQFLAPVLTNMLSKYEKKNAIVAKAPTPSPAT